MKLGGILSDNKSAILGRWFEAVLETYPADTSRFLRTQKNRFANPVGQTIAEGLEQIFDRLMSGDTDTVVPFLDNIIRIRAVQDFTPSKAVSFIFSLKQVVREELARTKTGAVPEADLAEFESAVDRLALLAFDIFMQCREKLYEIKANEVRNMTYRLLQRANMQDAAEAFRPDQPSGNSDNSKEKEVTQ